MSIAATTPTDTQSSSELVTVIDQVQRESVPLIPEYHQPPSCIRRVAQVAATGIVNAGIYTGVARIVLPSDVTFSPEQAALYYGSSAGIGLLTGIGTDLYFSPPGKPWSFWSWKDHVARTAAASIFPWALLSWMAGIAADGQKHKSKGPEMVQWVGPMFSGGAAVFTGALTLVCCKTDRDRY